MSKAAFLFTIAWVAVGCANHDITDRQSAESVLQQEVAAHSDLVEGCRAVIKRCNENPEDTVACLADDFFCGNRAYRSNICSKLESACARYGVGCDLEEKYCPKYKPTMDCGCVELSPDAGV